MGTATLSDERTVYFRIWVKYPSNWVNSPNGSKLIYHEGTLAGTGAQIRILTEPLFEGGPLDTGPLTPRSVDTSLT
jgi:hypothetical protein